MKKVTYKLHDLNFDFRVTLEIDRDILTDDWARESVLFFNGGEEDLDDCQGNAEKAYVKNIARLIFDEFFKKGEDIDLNFIADYEGYGLSTLDGSEGVKLENMDAIHPWGNSSLQFICEPIIQGK